VAKFALTNVKMLLCTATEFESTHLTKHLAHRQGIRIVVTGVGLVNAAHATTMAIAEDRPDAIVNIGIGGAYPSSGFTIGDVACASEEIYGDLGAQSPGGFLDMRALGFPVIRRDGEAIFNEIPMQVFPSVRRARFVTVSTCTGTESTAREIENRTRGAVENMEGAAIAHVANLHGIPVGEVRNEVGGQVWGLGVLRS
jgi:futalosine hydrolase